MGTVIRGGVHQTRTSSSCFFMVFLVHAHHIGPAISVFPSRIRLPGGFPTCARPTRVFDRALREQRGLSSLSSLSCTRRTSIVSPGRSGQGALYCAHRTSTVLSCAFCEKEGHPGHSSPFSFYWIADSRHSPSWIRMKVQASPDSVGISSLPSTRYPGSPCFFVRDRL
jgi:hypothetical protein